MYMTYDYDMIVIGGGAAGLTMSGIAASFCAKTVMIERELLGGDCTWTGCIPSKVLLKSAKVAHQIRHAHKYGLSDQPLDLDFGQVMHRMRHIRQEVYDDADSPEKIQKMGVEIRFGNARFSDPHTVEIENAEGTSRITGRYITIAAGARAFVPPIEGLADVPYLTNHNLFDLTDIPEHLAIVGGGPIGTEMAQAFRRFGAKVTVIDMLDGILANDDSELSNMLQEALTEEGITYVLGAALKKVLGCEGKVGIEVEQAGTRHIIEANTLLMATGRRPNLEGLNLEAAGVAYTKAGVTVNDRCRTSQRHIYAAGDVTGRYQFTHMSEHMAKVAASNAIFKVPMKIDAKHVPWVTYTDPELAHVGARERDLQAKSVSYKVYRFPYTKVDRAITDGETTGLIKVFAKPLSGKILGATILGTGAGDLICEYALAMRNSITLRQISDTIHPYPTYGLGVRRAADQWYAQKQTPGLVRMLQRVFRYRGPVIEPEPGRIV